MKKPLILLLLLLPYLLNAQAKDKPRKYPSLLWEISGNGLKKTSYLFGTMHVSSKIAFNLSDSFYLGIRNADVVALETNPESWQEDMSKFEFGGDNYTVSGNRFAGFMAVPDDYFTINTLKFYKYDKKIERSLYSNPSTINNLLYRSYGNSSSDFEEDTYLDMYIYQCGKKWGKKVAGVESYAESMRLMQEAYRDAAKEKNKKERSYDLEEDYSIAKLQEAYRKGNLDQLDSINKLNSFSDAFDEKFMYKRNEIQAASIDSILKTKQSLFVGVGAAHLPGQRGVIEMLRQMGYKLRPVMMRQRDSRHKEIVEKLRVPVTFQSATAEDGFFKVDIPGKFYKFGEDEALDQRQYADMANGSYYMVTRIMTNAWLWGHSTDDVYKKIDSLLYENIPGRILSKTRISRNGYSGFDITNKTRRGDIQRYHIFITPFEIIFFKMSGTGEYVRNGEEAKRFFGSIQLKELKPAAGNGNGWIKYAPVYGGFSAELPHEPYVGNDGSRIYETEDKAAGLFFRIIRSDIHNYHFAEEDSFDLELMQESFAASEFIDTLLQRKPGKHEGYPSLDCRYKTKEGLHLQVRFIIKGPQYFTLVAGGKKEHPKMQRFFDGFRFKPYQYGEAKERTDTSLYFSVRTPVFPRQDKEKLDFTGYNYYGIDDEEEQEESEEDLLESGAYRSKIISNDTTGEKIYVSFFRSHRYHYSKDSTRFDKDNEFTFLGDTSWIVREKKKYELPDKTKVWEAVLSDTGSSRSIITKSYYKDGIAFSLITQSDTLSGPSEFIRSFFETFKPADTLKGVNPFEKKSAVFFADLSSADSAQQKRAIKNISTIYFDSTDLPQLKKTIEGLSWNLKKYLEVKKSLIGKLSAIPSPASAQYLRDIYYAAGDTIELQYAALETLLQQKTTTAYQVFRDIISNEPPVIEKGERGGWSMYPPLSAVRSLPGYNALPKGNDGYFLDELHDSLQLTRSILPDLLPLLNLDDYKSDIMRLLGRMIDSSLVKTTDYEMYFSKFLLEARQELKKQAIAEKKRAIRKAEESKSEKKNSPLDYYNDGDKDTGNDNLELYARLLLPYWESKPAVQPVIRQMLHSADKRLKYSTLLLMIRNHRPYEDSLLSFFASQDEYRYELWSDLRRLKKETLFPSAFNNHLALGRSKLVSMRIYGKADSLVYVDRLPAETKGKKGYVYFYKYRNKKDDPSWKLAIVGLVPEDSSRIDFEMGDAQYAVIVPGWHSIVPGNELNITSYLDTKIKEDEPLDGQLNKELKKQLYALRKSGKNFYEGSEYERYDFVSRMEMGD